MVEDNGFMLSMLDYRLPSHVLIQYKAANRRRHAVGFHQNWVLKMNGAQTICSLLDVWEDMTWTCVETACLPVCLPARLPGCLLWLMKIRRMKIKFKNILTFFHTCSLCVGSSKSVYARALILIRLPGPSNGCTQVFSTVVNIFMAVGSAKQTAIRSNTK